MWVLSIHIDHKLSLSFSPSLLSSPHPSPTSPSTSRSPSPLQASEKEKESPVELTERCFRELLGRAAYGNIKNAVTPVLMWVCLLSRLPATSAPLCFFFSFWLFTETEGGNAVSVPYCSICSDSDRLCFFLVNLLTGGLDRQLRPPQATWASFPLATGNLTNKKYHTYPASNWNKVNKAMPVSEAKHLCSIFWI